MITLEPYQVEGAKFLADRKYALLADDMGLGKTFQALEAVKQCFHEGLPTVIFCPATVRDGWEKQIPVYLGEGFLVTKITAGEQLEAISPFHFLIMSYEMAKGFSEWCTARPSFKFNLIIDEIHYLKGAFSLRTVRILGLKGVLKNCHRIWGMTGTPVMNAPEDLYPMLAALAPERLGQKYGSYRGFLQRFCGGTVDKWGKDVTGFPSNLEELSNMLVGFMLRRTKKEKLPGLPPVRTREVVIPRQGYLDTVLAWFEDLEIGATEQARRDFQAINNEGYLSRKRKAVALGKVVEALPYLKQSINSKTILFYFHTDVADYIEKELWYKGVVRYSGSESPTKKRAAIDKFTSDKNTNIFLANFRSAAFGIDGLQNVCSDMKFLEIDWAPKMLEQAIDRLNRMGQESPVFVEFILTKDEEGVDNIMSRVMSSKLKVINQLIK